MESKIAAESVTHFIIDAAHQELIAKIARKYTQGTSISWEDAAQTATMKVYEAVKAQKFHQGGIAEFQRWATVVARYEILNLVKKESLRTHQSLDAIIVGTDISLIETIPDEFNLLESVESADLIIQAKQAIINLDGRYPKRDYLKLWELIVAGKNQTQQASVLGISQGEVSKRWKELVGRIAIELGLLQPEAVKREQQIIQSKYTRRRSKAKW
ncbi:MULTISPECIES: sigma-70 family RNA polymerase sigma factor [Calothrix]|uniref:Sigma-70 family RNA polymerase sigma factor n=2 Tax=Calothrix TaxID=1186 RepID=A0ABR8A3G5_9CYAN|nr:MULTISPECIES: sigma-70 family RNA polymerase sigma factor [Calothrix]MBD2194119.1 sigma-70 family RNA polymerase sigma factor [Calothrix parietina FACHB-288]MBD2227526.1 sigma-70 family RNA polymerase sigma factor [Calothrix anomala FACHB-343]